MNTPRLESVHFLRRFRETDTRVVLVGSMAAVTLGVPYRTQDIGFCYYTAEGNRARLITAAGTAQVALATDVPVRIVYMYQLVHHPSCHSVTPMLR